MLHYTMYYATLYYTGPNTINSEGVYGTKVNFTLIISLVVKMLYPGMM